MTSTKCIPKGHLLVLSMALLISGCYKKESAREDASPAATQETSPAPKQVDGPSAPNPTAAVADLKVQVDVYLEVSNGMKGFMPPPAADKKPTNFQSRLNKLLSEVQDGRYVQDKRFYLARENEQGKPVLDSVSYATLKNTVTSGIKADVRGTPLPDMLQAALQNSTDRGAVSVIISDFIHGPDPNNPGQFLSLDSDIRSSLKLAEQKNLVVAVLADASAFFGSYYPAVKKPAVKQTLNGEEVPFYIWVIGQQQQVQTVLSRVLRNLPTEQAYFGYSFEQIPFSALLKTDTFRPAGIVFCASRTAAVCRDIKLRPEKEEPVEFTIGLNLKNLPVSMQQEAYLRRHLKVAMTGGKATLGTVIAANDEAKARPELAAYSHFVRVRVPQLTANGGTLSLKLPQVVPSWITRWSTSNDNNPAAAPRKTYQFSSIMEGVQALYRDKNEDVFNATIQFNKETN